VIFLARANGIPLKPDLEDAVHRMALANVMWKKPDSHQFTHGDSDDTDLRDKITMGAWLFQDPVLKWGGYELMDYEGAWDFGSNACADYALLPVREPDFISACLENSGNYYLRENWNRNSNLLHSLFVLL